MIQDLLATRQFSRIGPGRPGARLAERTRVLQVPRVTWMTSWIRKPDHFQRSPLVICSSCLFCQSKAPAERKASLRRVAPHTWSPAVSETQVAES